MEVNLKIVKLKIFTNIQLRELITKNNKIRTSIDPSLLNTKASWFFQTCETNVRILSPEGE